jgi:hypothetical protein
MFDLWVFDAGQIVVKRQSVLPEIWIWRDYLCLVQRQSSATAAGGGLNV